MGTLGVHISLQVVRDSICSCELRVLIWVLVDEVVLDAGIQRDTRIAVVVLLSLHLVSFIAQLSGPSVGRVLVLILALKCTLIEELLDKSRHRLEI